MKTEIYPDYDWKNIPNGSSFTATISGKNCTGRIFKGKKRVYLCQNKQDGSTSPCKLGYRYSWNISSGSPVNLEDNDVMYLKVWLPEKGYKYTPKPTDVLLETFGYTTKISGDTLSIGCKSIDFSTVRAVYKEMLSKRKK